jgi:cell division septation protein DedD
MSKQDMVKELRKQGFNAYINDNGQIVIQGKGGN